jgi:hypothetical protein
LRAQARTRIRRVHREERRKVEALEKSEFLPSLGRTCGEAQEEAQSPLDQTAERIWTVESFTAKEQQEERTRRMDLDCRI